jgi:hypothetical protein
MSNGRTLKVFLVDGAPNGLLTAEIMNWTGHVITGPRTRLAELVQRPEIKRTAVYFLVGPESGTGIGTQVYIGETDDARERLSQHNRPENKGGKDFWERVCVVTSKDANLTKGHVKYLESRLIEITKDVGRCDLLNGTNPEYAGLPEADRSDMEFFVDQVRTLLPVLGFDFLRAGPKPQNAVTGAQVGTGPVLADMSPVLTANIAKHGVAARGREIDGEFVVFKGSLARRHWEGVETNYTKLFNDLTKKGVLAPTEDDLHNAFTQDYAFSSVSAAAAIVAGRAANGRVLWLIEGSNTTYGQWAADRVAAADESSTAGTYPSGAT